MHERRLVQARVVARICSRVIEFRFQASNEARCDIYHLPGHCHRVVDTTLRELFLRLALWHQKKCVKKHTINLAVVNCLNNNLGRLAVDLAANTVGSAKDLLHGSFEFLGERLITHGPGNFDDLIEGHRLVVFDVLFLLSITGGLLESPDDEG